eukprot:350699-Chlamydomonas_euryale.AAC.20
MAACRVAPQADPFPPHLTSVGWHAHAILGCASSTLPVECGRHAYLTPPRVDGLHIFFIFHM